MLDVEFDAGAVAVCVDWFSRLLLFLFLFLLLGVGLGLGLRTRLPVSCHLLTFPGFFYPPREFSSVDLRNEVTCPAVFRIPNPHAALVLYNSVCGLARQRSRGRFKVAVGVVLQIHVRSATGAEPSFEYVGGVVLCQRRSVGFRWRWCRGCGMRDVDVGCQQGA